MEERGSRAAGAVPGDVPDTICALPWVNLSLDVDGSSRPCCKFAHFSADSPYRLANLKDASLDEVWNSDAMQRLRADFRAGVRPAECSACWDEEAVGIPSFRQRWTADRGITASPDYDDLAPDRPVALDLKLSNACNLKCRICGPVASSSWLNEELQRGNPPEGVRRHLTENRTYFLSNKITGHEQNLATLRRWAPWIESVEMTGGEPMFSRENREVLDVLVEHGRPERTTLVITTNATVIDERMFSHLPRFGSVQIVLSIDDIEGRLEYERSPSRWPEVEANIARYAGLASPTCQVFTNCSVSIFNVWYLPEYFAWILGEYPDHRVHPNVNLVHNPRHYSVQVVPQPVKAKVADRLRSLSARLDDEFGVRSQVDEVVRFMCEVDEDPAGPWASAMELVRERDALRGEDFAETFPEYHAELVAAGCWIGDGSPVSRPGRGRRLLARLKG